MFLKYLDFVFAPFRATNNKIVGAKNIRGNIAVDLNRSKAMAQQGKQLAGQVGQMSQGAGAPPGQPPPSSNPPILTRHSFMRSVRGASRLDCTISYGIRRLWLQRRSYSMDQCDSGTTRSFTSLHIMAV